MSSFKPHHRARSRQRRPRRTRRTIVFVAAAAVLAIASGVVLGLTASSRHGPVDDSAVAVAPTAHGDATLPPGYRLTGEVNAMGGRVIETPGTRSGAASAGGVVVTDGADIQMGHVPLAFAVTPTWRLRNDGSQPVTFGQPRVEVVEGCCPSEPVLGVPVLAPGAETTLRFPTQMHPGMDGPHLFRLSVPVSGADAPLVVSVAGDFS